MIRKVTDVAIVAGGIAIGATVLAGVTLLGWALSKWEERR